MVRALVLATLLALPGAAAADDAAAVWSQVDALLARAQATEAETPREALVLYLRVLALHPGNLDAAASGARVAAQLDQARTAVELARRGIRLAKVSNDVWTEQDLKTLLGDMQTGQGRGDRSADLFYETVLSSNGTYLGCAYQGLGTLYGSLDSGGVARVEAGQRIATARQRLLVGDASSALRLIDAAPVKGDENDVIRAFALLALERVEEAAAVFETLPDGPERSVGLGHVALTRVRPERAAEHFDRVSDLAGSAPEVVRMARLGRGWLAANGGRHEEALAVFEQARAEEPEDLLARLGKANSLVALGRHDEAEVVYDELLGQDPRNRFALAGKAGVALEGGRLDEAEAGFQAALEASDGSYTCPYEGLGLVALARGRTDDAEARFQQAIAANPNIEAVKYNKLAAIRMERGDFVGAQGLLERSLANVPEQDEAHRLLTELQRLRSATDP